MVYTLVSCSTMSCENSIMMIKWMPSEMELERSFINALYSTMLLIDRIIQNPRKHTNSSLGEKIAHAAEDRLYVLRLTPST